MSRPSVIKADFFPFQEELSRSYQSALVDQAFLPRLPGSPRGNCRFPLSSPRETWPASGLPRGRRARFQTAIAREDQQSRPAHSVAWHEKDSNRGFGGELHQGNGLSLANQFRLLLHGLAYQMFGLPIICMEPPGRNSKSKLCVAGSSKGTYLGPIFPPALQALFLLVLNRLNSS